MLSVVAQKSMTSFKGNCTLAIDLSIPKNSLVGIYGNSGEGKTTLFNIIAGLVAPEQGSIVCNDTTWFSSADNINVPTQHRNIGYIFQNNNLFPHFTVKQNILYAVPKAEQATVNVEALLQSVEMGHFIDSYPHELSGGQVQRIALARALAQKARIILMDEPFSALDLEIKHKLYKLIKKFKTDHKMTILMITHDVNDLTNLCEEIGWIKDHKLSGIQPQESFKKEIEERLKSL